MAIDNLNYYTSGLPAGQQTDKYSNQPGFLKSKNLDIFSSSKSVRGTAWSEATTTDSDVIKQDGKLVLKTDGKVYERENGVDTLFVDPSINFPICKVSYTGRFGTYSDATWGTAQDMVAKYEGDELKSFIVFTDRASYLWSSVKFTAGKTFSDYSSNLTASGVQYAEGYRFEKNTNTGSTSYIRLKIDKCNFAKIPVRIYAIQNDGSATNIKLSSITTYKMRYYYDPELDSMRSTFDEQITLPLPTTDITTQQITLDVPAMPGQEDQSYWISITFSYTKKEGASDFGWSGNLYVDVNGGPDGIMYGGDGDYNEYYSYLPVRDRKLVSVGDYAYSQSYWMKGTSFQPLYKWTGSWITVDNSTRTKKIRYDFVTDMGWETDVSMDIIGMMVRNEQVYMIGNMDGNGYIIPCDLSGGRGTPYISYGCTFRGVTNIDYLMYLVGEDRGISQLWVFNGQELVAIVGGNEENTTKNLTKTDEQYRFDGKMVEYRGDLVLSTTDNKIFQYGQTYGGKGGAFIHQLPGNITDLKVKDNDLSVDYSVTENNTTTKYSTTYQDDKPIKRYNTEWVAEYPIVLGNHILEKEESDLYVSYILPSANCKLEFWGMANHYHFWTFTSSDSYTFSTDASYKMKGCTGNYSLKFIEKNDNQYTFRLEGDLPVQTTNDMKITDTEGTELITYTEYNHFRKIGEITTDKYQEGEFRFHNLNNKLELPKSHSLQIMVKGKGTVQYTPELFGVNLIANQRDRG